VRERARDRKIEAEKDGERKEALTPALTHKYTHTSIKFQPGPVYQVVRLDDLIDISIG